jgi:tRNA(fMet)-specific endonuclease VapC
MRAIALDTNTYTGFKRGLLPCVELVQCAERLLISSTVIGELLAGFACGTREARNREELSQFLASPRIDHCPCSLATADTYALPISGLTADRPLPLQLGHSRHLCTDLPRPAPQGSAHSHQ